MPAEKDWRKIMGEKALLLLFEAIEEEPVFG